MRKTTDRRRKGHFMAFPPFFFVLFAVKIVLSPPLFFVIARSPRRSNLARNGAKLRRLLRRGLLAMTTALLPPYVRVCARYRSITMRIMSRRRSGAGEIDTFPARFVMLPIQTQAKEDFRWKSNGLLSRWMGGAWPWTRPQGRVSLLDARGRRSIRRRHPSRRGQSPGHFLDARGHHRRQERVERGAS